jgi:Tol biopolymer transport system component
VLVALSPLVAHAAVGDVELVSRGAIDGTPSNGDSGPGLAVSTSGRFIAFESKATDLADGAQAGITNIYLRDRKSGTTTLVSRADGATGVGADGDSAKPSITPAGRFIAFESVARNLVPGANPVRNVFVRDTLANTTTLVSRASDGTPANGDSSHPSISMNGEYIAFASTAANISADNNDSFSNVYVRKMDTGEITLVSRIAFQSLSIPADGNSYDPTIDREGKRVAYTSDADNLSNKDNNAVTNVFVTDFQTTRFTFAVSLPTGGFLSQSPSDGDSFDGVISGDGRYVAFVSYANNFVDESIRTPTVADVFRRDIQASKTDFVSRATGLDGAPAFADSSHPSISGDGRFVAFQSSAGNLSPDDTADSDVFVRNLEANTTTLVSRQSGVTGAGADGSSFAPVLSRDGRIAAFSSDASNLSSLDDHVTPVRDVFIRQMPVAPPPPDTGPDLGSNDHSAHDPSAPGHGGHATADHAAAGHGGHTTATGAPTQSLVGPPVQDVDRLYVLAQVHGESNLVVTATVTLPGRGRATRVYSSRLYSSKGIPAHRINRVRLRLSRSGLKAVKRALKRGKRLRAIVVSKAQAATGGPWGIARLKIRLIDTR